MRFYFTEGLKFCTIYAIIMISGYVCAYARYKEEKAVYDFQKPNMSKRISAFLCDLILLAIVVVGIAVLLSVLLGTNGYIDRIGELQTSYKNQYGIVSQEEYNKIPAEERGNYIVEKDYTTLTDEERAIYDEADKAFSQDSEANYVYGMFVNSLLITVIFSILLGYLLLEFLIPLILKNGQTIGKKIFGIAIMREDGIRLSPTLLFARTVLGKYTVETMIPALIIIMIFLGIMGIVGTVVIAAILIAQIVLVAVTKTRSPIHDKLAHTVAVDYASQMIFDTTEEMLAYKKRIHAERVESENN